MSRLLMPPVAELMKTPSGSTKIAVPSLVGFYEAVGFFNYLDGTKRIKQAYKGLHNLPALVSGIKGTKAGIKANRDIVELASPLAFGRKTQVFDLPSKKFPFGRDRLSSFRVPFFFVEGGIIKVFLLLPRKGPYLNYDQICGVGTVLKRYLLEQEFHGEQTDVEIVDLSSAVAGEPRSLRHYSLADLTLWSDDRLKLHLSVVSGALDEIEANELIKKNRRVRPLKDADLPLFD